MLLGIDTSGAVSVAVARGELPAPGTTSAAPEILAVRGDERARHHDEVLLSLVDSALREAGASRSELTGVVVGRGPGPFTGLRVGLVSARTIASVLGLPLVGVCSLDALAHQALAEADGKDVASIAVALDARRREVYHALYSVRADGTVQREHGPAVSPPAEIAEQMRGADLLVGSGTALYPEQLPGTAPIHHADAGHLIAAAAEQLARGEDLTSTEPLYLRAPDAKKPSARKSALGR